jgi:predicted aconitase with swiveling domain
MQREFKGRVIAPGFYRGEAVVSRQGVNTLATFQSSALKNAKEVIVADQNNPDIFGLNITGKALCLPMTIGSTTGGMVIQTVCQMGIAPTAFLFSEHIDSLAASGIVLAKVWENSAVICVDQLGKEFIETVKTGDLIEVKEDGTVNILDKE